MQQTRCTRHQKEQQQNKLIRIIGFILVLMIGVITTVVLVGMHLNQKPEISSETSQDTQTVQTTSNQSTTQVTTASKPKIVVEDGIARVGDIIIVNKKYGLPKDYHPGEDAIAFAQFMKFKEKMQALGLNVGDEYSGFRSYELQAYFYDNYVGVVGQERADKDLARPGFSEHQTGLAFDFKDKAGNLLGEVPGAEDAVEYIKEHAHEYGFIVRYLKGKEHITGYMAETWHIRYVGDIAEDIYRSGLTLEEYFDVDGGDYAE